jgi:hypothetical protein
MAKRFISTEKWKKPWFKKLSSKYKVIWDYLYLDCDCAGVWTIDIDLLCFQTNEKVTLDAILETFKEQIYQIDSNKLLLIPFYNDQYGHTKESFSAKRKATETLFLYGIDITNNRTVYPPAGGSVGVDYKYRYSNSIGIGIGKDEQCVEFDTVTDYTHPLDIKCEDPKPRPQDIVDLWNSVCVGYGMPKVAVMNETRKKKLYSFLNEVKTLKEWSAIFSIASTKAFMGQDGRMFTPSFDYVLEKGRHIKFLEEAESCISVKEKTVDDWMAQIIADDEAEQEALRNQRGGLSDV